MTSPIPFLGVFGGGQSPSFNAPLITTLVPNSSGGDSTPTFTRATTAYVKDFEDVWRQVPSGAARFEGARMVRNLLGKSVVSNAGTGGWNVYNGSTYTTTTGITDPRGGTSAVRVTLTAGTAYSGILNNIGGSWAATNGGGVLSVYLKVPSGTLSAKLHGEGTDGVGEITVALTTTWQKFSRPYTASDAGKSRFFIISTANGNGDIFDVFEPQTEDVTGQTNQNPSEYVSVGVLSAPYHGAGVDGVKYFDTENGNTVASNVVTEATGAAIADATLKGYLAEGQRQNRCLYSQDFTNAAWVSGGGGIAVTPNTAVAPDGTTTADTLTASGANGTLIQDLGVVASAAKAGGLYLKRKTGTGNIDLTLDGGATWTTVAVTSSWLLLEKTQTLADEDFGIRIVTSGDEVYAWKAQVETATFISSAIPTTTAAVTRNASVDSYPASGNIAAAAGTIYLEFTPQHAPVGTIALFGSYVDANNYTAILHDATNLIFRKRIAASNYDSTIANAFVAGTTYKVAASWGSGGTSIVLDGTVGTPHANTTNAQIGTTVQIGADGNGAQQPFASIKNPKIWQTAKTDAQLQELTT